MKNTVKLRWALLCHGSSIDQKSNNVSLFGLIDQLNISSKAFNEIPENSEGVRPVPVSFELVSLWQRGAMGSETKIEVGITLVAPNEKTIKRTTQQLVFPPDKLYNRLIAGIPLIGISEAGTYRFIFALVNEDGKESVVGEVPVVVTLQD